jgi:hypothetical protein
VTVVDISRSPAMVTHRQPSRAPHPYRPSAAGTGETSAARPLRLSSPDSDAIILALVLRFVETRFPPQKPSYSEPATEAGDEFMRRLQAPPAIRRISAKDDV